MRQKNWRQNHFDTKEREREFKSGGHDEDKEHEAHEKDEHALRKDGAHPDKFKARKDAAHKKNKRRKNAEHHEDDKRSKSTEHHEDDRRSTPKLQQLKAARLAVYSSPLDSV